jgi:hypothetical protein
LLKLIHSRKDKEALHDWIVACLGINIPTKKICPEHCAPFDFIADVFFEEVSDVIAVANRNGGKTINFAIIDLLNSLVHNKCETATVGAIEEQAKKCYKYLQDFINHHEFVFEMVEDSLISETRFSNGSLVQILTGTINGVNSPHPNKNFLDEVDLMKWPVLQEAFSMAISTNGIKAQNILTSTRKYRTGPMSRLIAQADSLGFKTYIWCIRETVEAHDPEVCKNSVYAGDCKGACDISEGFYSFDDVISKKAKLDADIWESQWLCLRPSVQGLVYPRFSDVDNVTREWQFDPSLPTYIFEDFGYAVDHPDVALFCQVDFPKQQVVVFDEIYTNKKGTEEIIDGVLAKLRDYGILDMKGLSGWIGDPHGKTEKMDRFNKAAPMMEENKEHAELYLLRNSIPAVRKMIDQRLIKITPNCTGLKGELLTYSYRHLSDGTFSDDPQKQYDHGPDALRYGVIMLFPMLAYASFENIQKETVLNRSPASPPGIMAGIRGKIF